MHVYLKVKQEGVKYCIYFILYDINPQVYCKEERQLSCIHWAWFVSYYALGQIQNGFFQIHFLICLWGFFGGGGG